MKRHVTVIAEIGENHVGDMERAKEMVRAAARAGADIVKFQSYRAEDVAPDDPEKEWFAKVQLSDEAHASLKALAEQEGVEFLSAPFTLERARFLCETLGLKKIKIGSSEILNTRLLDYVARRARTVYLSTGLATLAEVRRAVARLKPVKDLCLLHCVTQYPTRPEDANLLAIPLLKRAFPRCRVGYSDHTLGIRAAVASAALGAEVIEKHFTLDKSLPGTDHVLSADPEELKTLVREVRALEVLLGRPEKKPVAGERAIKKFVRSRFPKTR